MFNHLQTKTCLSGPPGAIQDRLRHVFWPCGAQWIRRVLQPHERSHQLRHIGVQELRGDERGATGPGRAGRTAGHADAAGANSQIQTVIDGLLLCKTLYGLVHCGSRRHDTAVSYC